VREDDAMSANPLQNVTFPSNGHEAHGYLAVPPSGSGPGVIVIQEWWGLTDHIAQVCDRVAEAGFVALAPDLYGGSTTHDASEAMGLMQALPPDRAARDLSGAVDWLLAREEVTSSRLGVVGFCMGGGFVIVLASLAGDKVAAAVPFYGFPHDFDQQDLTGVSADVMAHWGEEDAAFPPDRARELQAKLAEESSGEVTFHFYDGAGHAFCNDENLMGTYREDLAAVAWERTFAFLRERVS
jgi:carboxymethylenebutenolidase